MKYFFIIASLFVSLCSRGQKMSDAELTKIVLHGDSLIFELGFNRCDMSGLEKICVEDLEFYHDQGGITRGKAAFIASMQNGICKLNYKAIRKLVPATTRVFPLYEQGRLYGAIQHGDHEFWAIEKDGREHKTGIAKFTILWLLKDGQWMFARALSYDHKALD